MRKFLTLLTALVCFSILTLAQTKEITGRVVDPQGAPVAFDTIRIKDVKGGSAADADGNVVIKAKVVEVLVISGTGLTEKEFPITSTSAAITIEVARKESNLTE